MNSPEQYDPTPKEFKVDEPMTESERMSKFNYENNVYRVSTGDILLKKFNKETFDQTLDGAEHFLDWVEENAVGRDDLQPHVRKILEMLSISWLMMKNLDLSQDLQDSVKEKIKDVFDRLVDILVKTRSSEEMRNGFYTEPSKNQAHSDYPYTFSANANNALDLVTKFADNHSDDLGLKLREGNRYVSLA